MRIFIISGKLIKNELHVYKSINNPIRLQQRMITFCYNIKRYIFLKRPQSQNSYATDCINSGVTPGFSAFSFQNLTYYLSIFLKITINICPKTIKKHMLYDKFFT